MIWLLTTMALASPRDEDGDGVRDRDDECLALSETWNGYADDDGCPDYLATLVVRSWIGLDQVPASLDVRIGPRHLHTEDPVVARDLVPGSEAVVRARYGCWVGTGAAEIRDGTNWIDVHLRAQLDARVTLTLTGADGSAVEEAVATWTSGTPGCAPRETWLPHGVASVAVGAGAHRVRIAAPGFEPVTVSVYAAAGEVLELPLELEPTPPTAASASEWDLPDPS